MKQFAIIGLGRFVPVWPRRFMLGHDVWWWIPDAERVDEISDYVTMPAGGCYR